MTTKKKEGANIKLAAGEFPLGSGPGAISIGMTSIDLPSEQEQRDGWFSEDAERIAELFRPKFKLLKVKGE
ncbi:MAG: hypothetical protein M3458_05300 [Acidobacteriota bacterium]|nr:hypothetical protein [Acidobacteriota bacterium]